MSGYKGISRKQALTVEDLAELVDIHRRLQRMHSTLNYASVQQLPLMAASATVKAAWAELSGAGWAWSYPTTAVPLSGIPAEVTGLGKPGLPSGFPGKRAMQTPTFEEAARLWPLLSDEAAVAAERDDDLYAACEAAILSRQIESTEDAALVCQVLLENLALGQRSDELDISAVAALRDWIARLALGSGLSRTARVPVSGGRLPAKDGSR